jgi:hypothetical protein
MSSERLYLMNVMFYSRFNNYSIFLMTAWLSKRVLITIIYARPPLDNRHVAFTSLKRLKVMFTPLFQSTKQLITNFLWYCKKNNCFIEGKMFPLWKTYWRQETMKEIVIHKSCYIYYLNIRIRSYMEGW